MRAKKDTNHSSLKEEDYMLFENISRAMDLARFVNKHPDRVVPDFCENISDFHKALFATSLQLEKEGLPWDEVMLLLSGLLHEYFALIWQGKYSPEPSRGGMDKAARAEFMANADKILQEIGMPMFENESGGLEFDYSQMTKTLRKNGLKGNES